MYGRRWQDGLMLALGLWLFVSPFWMYEAIDGVAAWNSYIFGVLVALFAVWALASPRRWEEWVQVALGLWLIVSPFVLIGERAPGAWNTAIVGVLVVADAIWALASRPTQARA